MARKSTDDDDVHSFDQSDSELPPLPSEDDDDSFLRPPSDIADNSHLSSDGGSAIIEREMKRKLMDIESSFLPDADTGEPSQPPPTGADDTYVFGGSPDEPGARNRSGNSSRSREPSSHTPRSGGTHAEQVALPESPPTPEDAYKTPAPGRRQSGDSDSHYEEGSSSFEENAPSSPSAAAAARSQTRTTDSDKYNDSDMETPRARNQRGERDDDAQSQRSGRPTSSTSTIKAGMAGYEDDQKDEDRRSRWRDTLSSTTSTLRSQSSTSTSVRKRPSFLRDRSRGASQRSSTSSFGKSDFSGEGHDNSDFALQSGGALPGSSARGSERDLSRLPSLGSIASSISGHSEGRPTFDRNRSTMSAASQVETNLERLDEEPRATSVSPPATPTARPFSSGTNGLTDTVVTKHVQNIRVPDTVAKEYREKHARSPDRPSTATFAFSSRTKHNLTLKEQNSKIDKLSKENFDLKLKIHFLDQALQNRSDEGVKDMISKNVQLQTDLATEKKENQSLRRKVRELERKLKAQEEGMAAAKERPSTGSDDGKSDRSRGQTEMEEEITYLRECLQQSETEIERLKEENLSKEVEKRRMAEYVKSMGERKNSEPSTGVEEAMEMWKDLLEAETARREQADEDAERLREEIRRMKAEREQSSQQTTNVRNTYNVSRQSRTSYARSQSGSDGTNENRASTSASSVTLVEQLKHENAELRRDLGAQTSMLVSRNRERERLQQEIEELKLQARRGAGAASVAGDSIFERSISRAAHHHRPSSRASMATRPTELSEAEREDYEHKQAQLRDEVASVKMVNQDLERELNSQLDLLEQAEEDIRQLKEERGLNLEDLQALQSERDEVLNALQDKENEFESLREEAIQEIEQLEQEIEQKDHELDRLMNDLENRNEDFEALQQEMKSVSESLVMLEDDRNASHRKIQQLEQELEDANQELESFDQKLHEAMQKLERFEVQSESNQGEISFLREEQEGDKIKIGDLEAALNQAQMSIQEEKERYKDLEDRVAEERSQREALDSQEKEEVQKAFDELNTQASKARDEVRRLRKELSSKEVEAQTWKQRLDDLESSLREALGSLDGTKANLLKDVNKLQKDLDDTVQELDHARTELAEKERTLRNRDTLLESTSLESRKLADMLDKERQLRMQDKRHFEQAQRKDQSNTRTIQSYETRILELETSRSQDRRRINQLEAQYKDQLLERNNLLLALWNRLSTLCGADWSQRNSLVNGELPTLEVIGRSLPAFSKNVLAAIKMVESIIGGFKVRIRGIEKDLWKEYQTIEHKLDVRIKHLDGLEKTIRSGSMGIIRNESMHQEMSRLKSENKMLRSEVQLSRQNTRSSGDSADHGVHTRIPHRSVSGPHGNSNPNRNSIASTLLRHNSSSTDVVQTRYESRGGDGSSPSAPTPQVQPTEQRWIHRLKELERRLKAEREARLLDRSGARKRLEEGRAENDELRGMLEREREKQHGGGSGRSSPSAAAFPTIGTR